MSSTSSSASNSASSFPSPSSLSHRFASNAAAASLPAEVTACRYLHAIGHVAAREHARHGRAGARAVVQDVAGMVGVEFDGCPAGRTWCECVRSPQDGANVHFHCPLNTAAPPPPPPAAPHTSPPPSGSLVLLAARSALHQWGATHSAAVDARANVQRRRRNQCCRRCIVLRAKSGKVGEELKR